MDSIRPIRFYKVSGTKILAVDTLSLRVRSSHHGWDLVPQRLDWIEIEERWHWGISLSWRSVPLGDIIIMKTCTYSTVMFEEHFKPTSTWMDFSAEHFPEHHNLSTDFLASHNASWCHHYPHDVKEKMEIIGPGDLGQSSWSETMRPHTQQSEMHCVLWAYKHINF